MCIGIVLGLHGLVEEVCGVVEEELHDGQGEELDDEASSFIVSTRSACSSHSSNQESTTREAMSTKEKRGVCREFPLRLEPGRRKTSSQFQYITERK